MSNVKQDVERNFKGKDLVALEVEKRKRKVNGKDKVDSIVKVTYIEKLPTIGTGKVNLSIVTKEVPGSKKRVLDAVADMYGQRWLKDGSPNYDVPRNLGDGRIFASLVGPGGYKYVNVEYAREIFIQTNGKPFLRTSVGYDVPLCGSMERNQKNLEAARKAFDTWSDEVEQKKLHAHGMDVVCRGEPLDKGNERPTPAVSNEVKDKGMDEDVLPACPMPVENKDENMKSSQPEKDATMDKDLLDTISLDPVTVRQVGTLSSDAFRQQLEVQHKETVLMGVALSIEDLLLMDIEEA